MQTAFPMHYRFDKKFPAAPHSLLYTLHMYPYDLRNMALTVPDLQSVRMCKSLYFVIRDIPHRCLLDKTLVHDTNPDKSFQSAMNTLRGFRMKPKHFLPANKCQNTRLPVPADNTRVQYWRSEFLRRQVLYKTLLNTTIQGLSRYKRLQAYILVKGFHYCRALQYILAPDTAIPARKTFSFS